MSQDNLRLLDCTLRDGGYHNKWDFDASVVSEYLEAMAAAEVDFVELGLRQFKNETFLGAHAYSTTEYLQRLNLPAGPKYGVMVDAKTILTEKAVQEVCIDQLFLDSKDERISLVRVAAHFSEVQFCLPMLARLKDKGYIVGLNVMQASLREESELEAMSALIGQWSCIDVVYFADSLGAMGSSDMEKVYRAIRKNWHKDIGFHAHNNMGQAISNVNIAMELGCTWIDSTVTGMGRGAGNAETEYVLMEPKIRNKKRQLSKLFDLVINHFKILKKSYGWGVSLPYYIGALNALHPTYVQELCADKNLVPSSLPLLLEDLGRTKSPHVFDRDVLDGVKSKINSEEKKIIGKNVPQFLKGREVLLVAQTASTLKYKEAIADYVKKKNPILMSVNFPSEDIDLSYDYIVISHNEKFRDDEQKYQKSLWPYIAPQELFLSTNINIVYDYGISVERGKFKNCGSYACIPFSLTLSYAVSFCLDAGACHIKLAGFSGFGLDDLRQKQMQEFLSILSREEIYLESLTPTYFAIPEKSLYAI